MINLRLARVQVQLKQADAALKTLDTIKGEGWAAIVADLRGEALLSKGDKQGARSAWEAGVKSDVTPALSEMMQMKINNLFHLRGTRCNCVNYCCQDCFPLPF